MQRKQKTRSGFLKRNETESRKPLEVPSISLALRETRSTNEVAKIMKEPNTEMLMEKILSKQNMTKAYKRVMKNKGSAGIDGITIEEFEAHLQKNWKRVKEELEKGTYKPSPVKRVEIPKANGKKRKLGIPTLTDRVIQQGILQILSPIYEQQFSKHSYGFRPQKNAHQAIEQSRKYIESGQKYVVDIDLKEFFDKVNHDKLMVKLAKTIKDKKLLKLIRRYLQSGIIIEGMKTRTEQGTPQGGNLSPLLANIVLDELDKELERRGHKFCRYADDCNIYVKSKRAAGRVLESVTKYIETKLKLQVNQEKSAASTPNKRKFLGFSFYTKKGGQIGISISKQSKIRIKSKLKSLSQRGKGQSIKEKIEKINEYSRGVINYYKLADAKTFFIATEQWLRRRLRMCIWKQWKRIKTRYKKLKILGYDHGKAIKFANTRKGYWRIAGSRILTTVLTNEFFAEMGLKSLSIKFKQLRLI